MDLFMSSVKVGPKGQIVIPKEIREMFGIKPGDSLIIMADINRGIALNKQEVMEDVAKAIFDGKHVPQAEDNSQNHMNVFAHAIHQTIEDGSCSH